jgi:hypothetical protein
MEPPQAKPLKKRRRWPIVTFVLVLGALVSWWHWPRGDARFVGKWSSGSVHPSHYELRANGTGTEVDEGHYSTTTSRLTWHATKKELVLRRYAPLAAVFDNSSRITEVVLGHEFRYTIHSYSPSELVLSTMVTFRGEKLPFYETLSRIPE